MTTTVNVHEAKTRLSALLALVESGEEVIIPHNGRPVTWLTPLATRTRPGSRDLEGKVRITPDFDEFSDDDADAWYGTPADR